MGQLVDNYDTCRTQVYYQYIGNAAKETHIEKSRTVQDNGIINAGYLKQGVSQNALIIKQNSLGQVIWQKEFGNAVYDEKFTDWRELPNRQLVVAGITKNRATLQSVFFMMQLTSDGNIIWQKSYADIAAASNITNAKVYPDFSGEYFFAAETDSSFIYGTTSNVGDLNWQRALDTNPGTKLVAGISYGSEILIATNALDSGRKVSNFYYVNYYWTGRPKTIKYTIKLGGVQQNSDYILHDVEQYGQFTYFSGIRSVAHAPYQLIRVNINQGYIPEGLETIVTPGVAIDSSARSAISTYGDAVSFTSSRKSNRLYTIKLTGSDNNPSFRVWSASYQLPDSIVIAGNIKTWDNGYVFFGFKELPGGNNKVTQLKTDSASLTVSCISRQSENFSVVRESFPTDTVKYAYNNIHGLTDFNYVASQGSDVIDTLTLCRELKCPQLPFSDNCLESYQKLYAAYEPYIFPGSVQVVNSRTFVSGFIQPMDYVPERSSPFIAEMNKNGQVVNQKKIVIGIGSATNMFKSQDSSLLLYGSTTDSFNYPSVVLAKIDTNLNVLWIKTLRLTSTLQYTGNQAIGEVKQGSDGSYFIQYSDGVSFGETMQYLTKLDVNGNFLWSKIYRVSYPGAVNNIKGRKLEISGGNVYMMCLNGYNSYGASIVIKVSENNGSLLWCKKYSNAQDDLNLTGMMNMYNNELVVGGLFSNDNIEVRNILLKITQDGNVLGGITLTNSATNTSPLMQFMHSVDGNIYMTSSYYSSPPYSNPFLINVKVNSSLNILTSKKRYSAMSYYGGPSLAVATGGQLYEFGSYFTSYNYYSQLYLTKFSPDGRVGTCPSDTMLLEPTPAPAVSVTNINCIVTDTFFNIRTPVYRADQFFLATTRLLCASVPGCDTLHITGSDSICDKSLQYTFHAVRNPGCSAPLQWIYDNTNVQVLNETDSSIVLHFLSPGSLLL
jgi:hypothetical protein